MKPLLVGQAPGPRTFGRPAFDGPSGRRLSKLLGADLLERVDAVNLVQYWPGPSKHGKGCHFPLREAIEAAKELDLEGRPVVLLAGRGVARAFEVRLKSYFETFEVRGVPAMIVPHPSGVSHWWNNGENLARAARVLRGTLGV